MASRRIKLIAAASALVLGAGGYFLYSVFAVQGQGVLAQAPLNVKSQVPPAFIMAVDDSGSMTFEGLYKADEQAYWNDLSGTTVNGFFSAANTMRTSGRGNYYHVLQNGIRLDFGTSLDTNTNGMRLGIPPLDLYGFARSPAYNKQYFDPKVTYAPWKNADGSPWADSPRTAARSDPRANGADGSRGPNPTVVYNFEQDTKTQGKTANYFAFRFQPGMRLPMGTEYYIRSDRHGSGCGGLGTTNGTRNSWQTITAVGGHLITTANNLTYNPGNGNDRGGGCEIHINYYPAVVYLPVGTDPPPGFKTANATTVANAGGPGVSLVKYVLIATNFTTGYDDVIKNFANWYTYYGNRNRAMIAAMSDSMWDVNNMRVGYFSINRRSGNPPGMAAGNLRMRNMNSETLGENSKPDLFADLYTLRADGGTPTRSATVYMGDQFNRKPVDENDDPPVKLACQINAGMLFTDGYTNEGGTYGNAYRSFGDTDNSGGEPRPIAGNANGNTIADIAYSFYKNRLRDDIPAGLVRPREGCELASPSLKLDCQTNLHMNFYGITLGATGKIYGVNAAATADPYTTLPNWEVTGTQVLDPKNVDDIWHAAINTRGEFVNAQRPSDITAAMRRVLAAINAGKSPSGSLALTGARIGTGSLTVSPFYEAKSEGTDWYSTLTANTVSTNPLTGEATFTNAWEASSRIPAAAGRDNVWFGSDAGTVLQFNAANIGSLNNLCNSTRPGMSICTGTSLAALGGATTPITIDQAVAYLKGDQTLELGRGTGDKLRFRTTRLGDIVNSTPVVSAPTDDYGYRSLPAPYGASYNTYMTSTAAAGKAGRRPMVYAGANDGMLHAFDGRTGTVGGVERFAYIPQSVVGYMGNLLFPRVETRDQKFQHRYYVDGPVAVSDAYYGGAWETVLVGTTGAGARGVFAINVSDAANPSASVAPFAADDRLWEINDLNSALPLDVRENIGHVLGKPVIVPVKTGTGAGTIKWKAIFGNGYNSISRKAVLFLVDIGPGATATNITMIEAVESGPGVPSGANGLGNLVVTDRWGPDATSGDLTSRFRDGFADTVYAADQKGAIWKFDLREADPVDLTTPLFTTLPYADGEPGAGYRQPILGGLTAASGPGGGVLIYFGTGSFSFDEDTTDNTLQSLYAVLDNNSGTTKTRANLLEQTIESTDDGVRMISSNLMTAGLSGWYIDLPEGERFVGYPRIESGVVFMPTYVPNAAVGCGGAGSNWLYGLNALTGAAGLSRVREGSPTGPSPGPGTGAVALNTGGTAPVKDVAVMTSPRIKPLGSGATDADLAAALGAQCSMVVQVAGAPPLYLPRACGRQSWRQIQ